uniref:ADAM metallopeptidase domain 23 n=1 Tax=Cyclopterus lumpus TaxID=8103 RepID=A0A8C3ALX8_CYCLU
MGFYSHAFEVTCTGFLVQEGGRKETSLLTEEEPAGRLPVAAWPPPSFCSPPPSLPRSLLLTLLLLLLSRYCSSKPPGGDAVPALLKQQETAAPATENTTHHAVEHVITYPSRLIYYLNEDSESTYHDLDTRVKDQSENSKAERLYLCFFCIASHLSTLIKCNFYFYSDLLSSDYVEIHYEAGKPILSKGGEHCYYHGQVRGNDNSHVALSTCNGLHPCGIVRVFALVMCNNTPLFLLFPSVLHPLICPPQTVQIQIHTQCCSPLPVLLLLSFSASRSLSMPFFIPPIHCALQWQIFKEQLHTRVVLVAVEIWTDKDQIPISVRPLEMLRDFSKYRQQILHLNIICLNVTFHYRRSSAAYFGGMCSGSRGVGVNEYGTSWSMAGSLSQSLAQNLGIQWDPASRRKECGCVDSWTGCIMEDTGVQHPRRFSKCSISDYKEFLLKGGGSCLFNRPTKLFEATECGNGFVEVGEECDCGARAECYKECCKKCSLANGAHCSDGPCCNNTCLFYPRGFSCRYAVNDCDISETCSGDSGQCPPNLHKQDGYLCQVNQGRCYSGECKTRENQCKYIWGSKAGGSEKFCYEKLNTEGTEKGNCGKDGDKWIQCSKHDVFCGYLLCTNIGRNPRIGMMKGDITLASFNPQGRLVDCSGGHVLLDDETDLGYVEDGTPCGPSMMCLDHKCLPIQSLNMSTCPSGPNGQVCSAHGVCNNEATCTCDTTWAGTDCSMPDPPKEPEATQDEGPKGPSATNLIIGSIAGAILVAAIVLGGTGWEKQHKKHFCMLTC